MSPHEQPDPAMLRQAIRCRVSHIVGRCAFLDWGMLVGSWRTVCLIRSNPPGPVSPPHQEWSIIAFLANPRRKLVWWPKARGSSVVGQPPVPCGLMPRRGLVPGLRHCEAGRAILTVGFMGIDLCDNRASKNLRPGVSRTFDQGWHVRIGRGPEQPVLPVDLAGFRRCESARLGHRSRETLLLPAAIDAVAATSLVALLCRARGCGCGPGTVHDAVEPRLASHHGLLFELAPDRVHERGDKADRWNPTYAAVAQNGRGAAETLPAQRAFL